jgi:hypothetical protein
MAKLKEIMCFMESSWRSFFCALFCAFFVPVQFLFCAVLWGHALSVLCPRFAARMTTSPPVLYLSAFSRTWRPCYGCLVIRQEDPWYSCICCLREARNTAALVAKVLFCHKHGRNTSAGGLRTSWTVPPFIVSLYMRFLCFENLISVLYVIMAYVLCLSKFSDLVIRATFYY